MIKEVRIQTFGNLKIEIDGTPVYEAEPYSFIPKIWLMMVLIATEPTKMLRTDAIPELLEEAGEKEEFSSHRVKAWVLRLRRKLNIESVRENVIIRTRHGYCWNPEIMLITDWDQITQEIKNNPEQAEPDCTEKFMPGCQARFVEQRREVLRTMMDCNSYRQAFGEGILKWSREIMNFLTISLENFRPAQGREAAYQFEKIMQEAKPDNSMLYKLTGGQYLLILPNTLDPAELLNSISQRFSASE